MTTLLSIVMFLNIGLTTVQTDRIKKAVEEYVAGRWNSKHEQYLLEFRNVPAGVKVSSAEYSIRVGLGSVPKLKGYVGFPVEVICNGKIERRVIVPAHLRTFATVASASRQIQRHEEIGRDAVAMQRVETTSMPDDVVFNESEILRLRSGRIIAANSILCRSMLDKMPVVKPEDAVTIAVRSGKATVTARGIAKQEGCIGDMIVVQRSGSSEKLKATVLDARTVLLEVGQFLPDTQDN